ncbi:DUF262 domain-containing protein [Oerskovia sp. Root22]|uniref:DUF262 domain-containing protein n=1 Tax=Oerskovia sp. Root22 TaxID=1736494 RepID=UPI0009E84A6E|nr:DUF262 domain-containing protein [Oerskovia sp. Root22]
MATIGAGRRARPAQGARRGSARDLGGATLERLLDESADENFQIYITGGHEFLERSYCPTCCRPRPKLGGMSADAAEPATLLSCTSATGVSIKITPPAWPDLCTLTRANQSELQGDFLEYTSATSKAAAVARIYVLAGIPPEPIGRGSKEKKSSLEALGASFGLELRDVRSKHRCAQAIAGALGAPWDDGCQSAGDTITLKGMNLLVDAAARAVLARATPSEASVLVERLLDAHLGSHPSTQEEEVPMSEVAIVDEVEQNVADYLARLSEPGAVPENFGEPTLPFSAEDVRFDDGSWRQRLLDVQYWLNLSTSIDDTNPDTFGHTLSEGLGLGDDAANLDLFSALEQRLEKALALRDEFRATMEEAVEGTATLTSASLAWVDAWEDEEDDEGAEQSGPIDAEASTWPIASFVGYASDDELNLSPSYQRADVWPTGDAQKLIESIVRGIPLPSVIILERETENGTEYEVVDGKQRLTSILRFIGAHPRALKVVEEKSIAWGVPNLLEIFRTDYRKFRSLWKTHETEQLTSEVARANQFPFPLRSSKKSDSRKPLSGDLEPLQGKYYYQVRDTQISVQGKPRKVSYIFEKADASYKIPVIVYKQVTTAQVHEVFYLYNKQGKRLNAEEIRNALYHRLDLMRALLVTAGDSSAVDEVANFLVDDWEDLSSTGTNLTGYAFGAVGYKRTKVLSWVVAALLLEDKDGDSVTRSTAAHIDALLQRIAGDKHDPLRDPETVRQAMLLVDHGLDAHATPDDVWSKTFRSGNAKGAGNWQELRLVASLIALSAAGAVLGDDLVEVFEDAAPSIRDASERWQKPSQSQSKEQWRWIGFVVGEILRLLGVEPEEAHVALKASFAYSGLRALVANAETPSGYVAP